MLMGASAAHAQFTTTVSNNQVTITGYSPNTVTTLVIPGTIGGLPVTAIGDFAFQDYTSLASLTIPASVTSIGNSSFQYCVDLTSLTIPNGVTSVGTSAFSGCTGLTAVSIPSSVTSLGFEPFADCNNLTFITVSPQNTAYSNNVDGLLFDKNQTTLIECPSGLVGSYVFPVNSTLTTIGNYAFAGCSLLYGITLPSSVTTIETGAFAGCYELQQMAIPANVISIASDAFDNCFDLFSFTVDSANSNYSSTDGVLFNKNQSALLAYPMKKSDSSYVVPAGVITIGQNSFYNCTNLTSVTIPSSVTGIGDGAFYECTGLTNIVIGSGVTSIGQSAFGNCYGLTGVTIPNGVITIKTSAFNDCIRLKSVTIPNSVTTMGAFVFENCDSLQSVVFLGDAPTVGSSLFSFTPSFFTVHYVSGKAGFASPTWTDTAGDTYPAIGSAAVNLNFGNWTQQTGYFTPDQLADPAVSGPDATPQNDGVPNLLKYFFDIDPAAPMTAADRAGLPVLGTTNLDGTDCLTLTYRQYFGANSVTMNVQTSSDMQTWTTLNEASAPLSSPSTYAVQETGIINGDPIVQIQVPHTGSTQFIRLQLIQQP
jgi:BspA type Leucine rich repeat region (6 copies)